MLCAHLTSIRDHLTRTRTGTALNQGRIYTCALQLLRRCAPVYQDRLSGNEAGASRTQPQHQIRYLSGLRNPTQWDFRFHELVQRLRILRTQASELTDDGFHAELADIVTRLRDAHTRYAGPSSLAGKVAALPFLVEAVGSPATFVALSSTMPHWSRAACTL